jgi:hypothetical protein
MSDVPLNYHEIYKNTPQSNELSWRNSAPLMALGIVVRVIDINTVVAVPAVNTAGFSQPVTVTLLHVSSALAESAVEPQAGDRVLLLSLDLKTSGMFHSDKPITDRNAASRGFFSCVGVMLSVFKGLAATTVLHEREGDDDLVKLESAAILSLLLGRALTVVFESISGNAELIKLAFGKLSPLLMEHGAAVTRRHGFDEDGDGNEIAVPAPVTEQYSVEAPLTAEHQAAVSRRYGFAKDADGNETVVAAPVTERHSEESPITRDIQGAQTITVGVDADGNATEAPVEVTLGEKAGVTLTTEAPVEATLGEKADVTLTSKAGLKLSFEKAVVFETKDGHAMKIGGDLTLEVSGKVNITSAGLTINNVLEVR